MTPAEFRQEMLQQHFTYGIGRIVFAPETRNPKPACLLLDYKGVLASDKQQPRHDFESLHPRYIARFWANVQRLDENDCWPWLGRVRAGYGTSSIYQYRTSISAHRLALASTVGFAQGMYALHSCDNKLCCNPKHLRWGSQAENLADLRARNAAYRATNELQMRELGFSTRKLSPPQVEYIRLLLAGGFKVSQCAEWYGVGETTIRYLAEGRTYADV